MYTHFELVGRYLTGEERARICSVSICIHDAMIAVSSENPVFAKYAAGYAYPDGGLFKCHHAFVRNARGGIKLKHAARGELSIFKLLVRYGRNDFTRAFNIAVECGNIPVVRYIFERNRGANVGVDTEFNRVDTWRAHQHRYIDNRTYRHKYIDRRALTADMKRGFIPPVQRYIGPILREAEIVSAIMKSACFGNIELVALLSTHMRAYELARRYLRPFMHELDAEILAFFGEKDHDYIKMFALRHNMLRIYSGMSGLRYSS